MGKKVAATTFVSEQSLKLLKSANSFVAIPGVGVAADAALSILALAQTVRSNKEAFVGVGEKACTIMVEVVRKVHVAEQPGSKTNKTKLEEECGALCSAMKDVKKTVEKHLKGRKHCVILKRILYSQSDQDVIKECKDRLQKALDVFSLQGFIEIRLGVDEANRKLDDLAKEGKVGGRPGPTTTQYAGQNAYSYNTDQSVHVDGTGNNVNVSHASVPQVLPTQYAYPNYA